jgi:hypothetical protein
MEELQLGNSIQEGGEEARGLQDFAKRGRLSFE